MNRSKPTTWIRATLLAVPVLATQVVVTQLQVDTELRPLAAAFAQQGEKKPERETRRTPALRNAVYEKLSKLKVTLDYMDIGLEQVISDLRDEHKLNINMLWPSLSDWYFYINRISLKIG